MEEAAGAFFAELSEGSLPTARELCVTAWKASEVPAIVAAQFVVSQLAGEEEASAKAAALGFGDRKHRRTAVETRSAAALGQQVLCCRW